MRMHLIRPNVLINIDRVLYAEIEPVGYTGKSSVRWTLQGNRTFVVERTFDSMDDAVDYVKQTSWAGP